MTTTTIRFTLNGRPVEAEARGGDTILRVLQERFALYGARESCSQGLCGCCTVLVDGDALSGCLTLAQLVDGREVRTVEGLEGADGALDPVQEAFVEAQAFQCGFCTPGFVLMVKQLLERNPDPTDGEARDFLSGNLCRCAAYPEILDAVRIAARRLAMENAA